VVGSNILKNSMCAGSHRMAGAFAAASMRAAIPNFGGYAVYQD
jgi:hypothetical protein